jgi:low temperature requirement protein LtrA
MRPHLRSAEGLEAGRRVTWLELFFDLVFVAAIAQVATHLRDDYSLTGALRFSVLFLLIWWAWLGHTTYSTRFDTDDAVQRSLTGLQMFLAIVMAINATGALDSRDSAGFAAAYAVMRLVLVVQYLRVRHVARARELAGRLGAGCAIAASLWLASAFVPAPARFWVWGVALVVDLGTPLTTTRHLIRVPHDAAHLPERYGLFSIILLGESMVAIMRGMEHQEYWSPWAASAAILSLALIFSVWWWYFDGANAVAERFIRTKRDAIRFHVWTYAHLPLYLSIAVTGAGLEHVIATAADAPLHSTEAWILSGAVATMMAAIVVIGATTRRPVRGTGGVQAYGLPALLLLAPLATAVAGIYVMPSVLVAGLTAACVAQLVLVLAARSHAVPGIGSRASSV